MELDLETAGVAEVSAAMASGSTTSVGLVGAYLERIDRLNPLVNAIRCLAPDAEERAAALDAERADGRVRGPLHGVPVLVKDNIDVAGLPTTAGALALEHSVPDRDADLVVRLREAGAVVIGKTNLTEMANCMAEDMPSGYSSLGGQVLNPYDVRFDPSGSSTGSGRGGGARAGHRHGRHRDRRLDPVAGVEPEPGRREADARPGARHRRPAHREQPGLRRADVPHGRRRGGAARGADGRDVRRGAGQRCSGVRLALPPEPDDLPEQEREVFRAALDVLREQGAVLVEVPALPETDEFPVLLHEFARDLDAYLARLPEGAPIRTMRELVAWNAATPTRR